MVDFMTAGPDLERETPTVYDVRAARIHEAARQAEDALANLERVLKADAPDPSWPYYRHRETLRDAEGICGGIQANMYDRYVRAHKDGALMLEGKL